LDEFSEDAAKQIRQGKPLTGKDGIFSPLIKQIIEAALEGELDNHLNETRELDCNRRNGHTQKSQSSLGGIEIFAPRDRNASLSLKR